MGFFKRRRSDEVEKLLRSARPLPPSNLVASISERAGAPTARRRSRLAFAAAATTFALGSLISFGGLGYAASASYRTVEVVKRIVVTSPPRTLARSSASDQYRQSSLPQRPTPPPSTKPVHGARLGAKGAEAAQQQVGRRVRTTVKRPAVKAPPVKASGQLPFTGLSLAATLALSAALVALGLFLRRREGES
jgi:hypothetical protein